MKVTGSTSYGKVPKVILGNKEKIQFHIHDFANLGQEVGEYIITECVKAHGHLWNLHVYPQGHSESDNEYVWLFMFCTGVDNEYDPVDAKAMIRTKTADWKFKFSKNSRGCAGSCNFSTREHIIENDCNDDHLLLKMVMVL